MQNTQSMCTVARLAFEGVRCSFMFSQARWHALHVYKAGRVDAAEERC